MLERKAPRPGRGILTVDLATLHDALHLPADCTILAFLRDYATAPVIKLIIASPTLPALVEGHALPLVQAVCTSEPCPDHEVCPDCRRFTTRLEPIQRRGKDD